jgi:hypothetical protein
VSIEIFSEREPFVEIMTPKHVTLEWTSMFSPVFTVISVRIIPRG